MKIKVCTISKLFPKHLMERFDLVRYVGKTRTKIVIDYDPATGEGFMNVYQYMSTQKFCSGDWMPEKDNPNH